MCFIEEVGDRIAKENEAFELTDAQKRELDDDWRPPEKIQAKDAHGTRLKLSS